MDIISLYFTIYFWKGNSYIGKEPNARRRKELSRVNQVELQKKTQFSGSKFNIEANLPQLHIVVLTLWGLMEVQGYNSQHMILMQ